MAESALNITIRVNGKQAQQQLRAVASQIKQVQQQAAKSMVGQSPTTAGASSAWSPRIAQQQARAAAAAAKAAAAAQQKILNQAWKRQTAAARIATAQQNKVLTQAWNQQQRAHKAHQQTLLNQQKTANAQALARQKVQAKKMSALGGLTPLGFAENLQKSKLVNAGKNINWVGRQLTYNFTLPLVAAGAGLMKFGLDVERATTQLSKVYGDITEDQTVLKQEVEALSESFRLLSSFFGVNQTEVIEIGAAWAAAGSAGRGLAENTRATLETMILGDMQAAEATEALIAIQAQWGFSTVQNAEGVSDLTLQLAHLNSIENATGISTQGLIEIIQRAGGTARNSGLEFRELGALAAALVPATGDAAQAGTALRSIISSLMAPTAQATEALQLMGITVTDQEFMGQDVMGRLRLVAEHFDGLSDAQKGVVSSTIATKWQVARFDVLMRQIQDPLSFFNKALEVTSNDTRSLETRQRELNEVLSSNPKKFDIMTNAVKNSMAEAFIPMIPAIMSVVKFISDLIIAFTNLSPEVQKFIMIAAVAIAVLGPVMSLLGSTMQLVGVFSKVLGPAGKMVWWFVSKALFPLIESLALLAWSFVRTTATMIAKGVAPMIASLAKMSGAFIKMAATAAWSWLTAFLPAWAAVAVIAAVVVAIILILDKDLRDRVWDIIVDIGRAFAKLPEIIGKALMAVLRTIGLLMQQIVEALSYLNPFARHSPSLVDNVRRGVSTILDEYSRLRAIPSMLNSAVNALAAFSNATNAEGQNFREADLRKKANVEGASPAAQSTANNLVTQILQLERALEPLESAINQQEQVVQAWADALKVADDQIDEMEKGLKALEKAYDSLGDQIAAANDRIGDLADTPIQGMGALEDQIFANQHAQNLLNMELLEFERRGLSLDSITDKYAAMAGEIETLQGTQAELRGAGAGSDILGWYDDQINAIRSQRSEMSLVETQILDIENRLNALDLEGRFLELTKAINFDPLERQIDQIANQITEMPFEEIVRQILEQQAIVEQLTPEYEAIGAQVEREKEAIEAAKVAREGVAAQLEIQQEKLDQLEQAYSDIKDLLGDMESALSGFASAMKEAADDASRLEELFEAGEGVDFEDFGGGAALGREGALADIEAFNAEMDRLLQEAMEKMGEFDLMTPLKEAWEKAKTWLKGVPDMVIEEAKKWWPLIAAAFAVALIGMTLGLVPMLIVVAGLLAGALLAVFWDDIKNWLIDEKNWMILGAAAAVGIAGFVVGLVPALIIAAGLLVGALLYYIWDQKDEIWAFWSTVGWDGIKGLVDGMWQGIQRGWDDILEFLDWLWWKICGFFGIKSPSTLFAGLGVDMILGLIEGLASMMQKVWDWFIEFGGKIWQWAYDNIIGKVLDAISPLTDKVSEIFNTMSAAVGVIWNGLGTALQTVFDTVIAPIFDGFTRIFNEKVKPAFQFLQDEIIRPIMEGIYNGIKSVWNSVNGLIEGGVNFFIDAFNLLAGAVNAVTGFLQINLEIGDLEHINLEDIGGTFKWGAGPVAPRGGSGANVMLATGGVVPAHGGTFNHPAAIVGEGSRRYEEYVIPTDPKYRANALALMAQAGTKLLAAGGIIGNFENLPDAVTSWNPDTWGAGAGSTVGSGGGGGSSGSWGPSGGGGNWLQRAVGAVVNAGKEVVKGAVRGLWSVVKKPADFAIGKIPAGLFRKGGQGIMNVMDNWVMGRSNDWDVAADGIAKNAAMIDKGATGPTGSGVTAGGIPIHHGSGSWQAFTALLQANGIPYTNLGTYANRQTKYGTPSMHAQNRAMDFGGSTQQLQRIDHALYDAFKPHLHELIWSGPNARNVYKGQDHMFRSQIMNDHKTHVHASMAQGGRFNIPRIPGGVNLNVSEGRSGEQVQILPIDEAHGGGTTIVINGNLEFPNVKDGTDANDFIQNLRALAN